MSNHELKKATIASLSHVLFWSHMVTYLALELVGGMGQIHAWCRRMRHGAHVARSWSLRTHKANKPKHKTE